MSNQQAKLTSDMKTAMKAGDKVALGVIRGLIANIKKTQIDSKTPSEPLTDEQVLNVIIKAAKQRKDSIVEFTKANREDLKSIEEQELLIIEQYLPKQLSQEELESIIADAITQTGAQAIKDMGKVMAKVKSQVDAAQDMALISKLIKAKLA